MVELEEPVAARAAETAGAPLLVVDDSHTVIFANRAAVGILPGEPEGSRLEALVGERDRARISRRLDSTLAGGSERPHRVRLLDSHGFARPFEVAMAPWSEKGRPFATVTFEPLPRRFRPWVSPARQAAVDEQPAPASKALERSQIAAGVVAAAVSVLALLGWALDVPILTSIGPQYPTIKINAAIGYASAGIALALLAARASPRWVVQTLAALTMTIGLAVVMQYLTGLDLGIDELFKRDVDPVLTSHPGRPSPLAAAGHIMIGASILALTAREPRYAVVRAFAILTFIVALLATTGYVYGAETFFGATEFTTGIAIPAVVATASLALGLLATLPETRRFWNERDTAAARLLIILLPVAVLLPILVGYVVLAGQRVGAYDSQFRLSLITVATTISLLGFITVGVRAVRRADAARERAYRRLRESHVEIEAQIRRRTRDLSEALRERERLAAIVEASSDAIFSIDDAGAVRTWNKGATETFGYTEAEATGKHVPDLIVPAEHREEANEIIARLREGERVRGERLQRMTKEGRRLRVDVTAFPLHDADGRPAGAASIARDVTKQVRLEDALMRSNRDLQSFAYVASHDLQEPLRMVASYCELLDQRYKDKLDKTGQEFLGFAVDGARRMQSLIADLLSYSRVATRTSEFESTSLADCVEEARKNLTAAIGDADAKIEVSPLPTVEVDPGQTRQLFQNLIGNAIKFRRPAEKAHLRIRAERGDREWIVSVADNGIGLEQKFADRIFEPFQRLHTRDEYSGTGMGLAICKRIVERRGGRIWVESQIGEGSEFRFTIPDELPET